MFLVTGMCMIVFSNLPKRFFILFFSYSLVIFLEVFSLTPSWAVDAAEITIHNVGQGNCITVKKKPSPQSRNSKPEYMLIDAGSSAYGKEIKYIERQAQFITPFPPVDPFAFTESAENSPSSATQLMRHPSPVSPFTREGYFEEIRTKIRQSLGALRKDSFIEVKTIIVTHPDEDHYSWLPKLFNNPRDKITNIILGGLPEHYNTETQHWLDQFIRKKTYVFFPAIQYEPIKSIKAIMPQNESKNTVKDKKQDKKEKRKYAKEKKRREDTSFTFKPRQYAEQAFMTPEGQLLTSGLKQKIEGPFKEAFNFGEDVKIFPLSINPCHFCEGDKVKRCSDGKPDDNKESLVLKIINGKQSMLLMGDATEATTNRIFENYEDSRDFLITDCLLSSHHGSFTHGSNSPQWLSITQPKYIFISNGLFYGHPSPEAYKAFHIQPLQKVQKHKVLVGKEKIPASGSKEKNKSYNQGILHETYAAIFSTLNSGSIIIILEKEALRVRTAIEDDIKEAVSLDEVVDSEEDVNITGSSFAEETEESGKEFYIVTPKKGYVVSPQEGGTTPKAQKQHRHIPPPLSFLPVNKKEKNPPKKEKVGLDNSTSSDSYSDSILNSNKKKRDDKKKTRRTSKRSRQDKQAVSTSGSSKTTNEGPHDVKNKKKSKQPKPSAKIDKSSNKKKTKKLEMPSLSSSGSQSDPTIP